MNHAGRILYAIPFLIFGIMHFAFGQNMKGLVPSFIPGDVLWVYITGAGLILASIAILTKKLIRPAAILLAIMLFIFILFVHLPGLSSDNQQQIQMAMSGALKDLALLGGALYIATKRGK